MFGPHLMIDAYQCPKEKLADLEFIYRFLDECPDRIGMHKIIPPYVFRYEGTVPEDWGVSGVVLIAESHISVHTFVEKGYVSVDIFSCKNFDTAAAIEYIAAAFESKKYETNILNRGTHFPRDLRKTLRLVKKSREKVQEKKQSLEKLQLQLL